MSGLKEYFTESNTPQMHLQQSSGRHKTMAYRRDFVFLLKEVKIQLINYYK